MTHTPDPTPVPASAPEGDVPALERQILGQDPQYSASDVAGATGLPIEDVRRLWRALGLPEHGPEERAYNQRDLDSVETVAVMMRSGLIDLDVALNLARGLGQTMARLAEWQTVTLAQRLEELEGLQPADQPVALDRVTQGREIVDTMVDQFEPLLGYAWRRHLAAAVARLEALGELESDLDSTPVTVGFADIVQFTALSNSISRAGIGDLVEVFEARCQDVVAHHGGRVVKSIGDSVLFITETPVAGMEIAEGIIQVIGRDPRMPDVRVGLASGQVVMRMGDVFGPPVNLAARLTAVARRNRIVIDASTAEELPQDRWESRRMPARPVRGFGLVEPLTVRRR